MFKADTVLSCPILAYPGISHPIQPCCVGSRPIEEPCTLRNLGIIVGKVPDYNICVLTAADDAAGVELQLEDAGDVLVLVLVLVRGVRLVLIRRRLWTVALGLRSLLLRRLGSGVTCSRASTSTSASSRLLLLLLRVPMHALHMRLNPLLELLLSSMAQRDACGDVSTNTCMALAVDESAVNGVSRDGLCVCSDLIHSILDCWAVEHTVL